MTPSRTKTMNLCFFLSLSLIISSTSARNLVYQTCKNCSQTDPNINYNFCVSSLLSIPKSHNRSLHQLGIISINLTRSYVTHTRSYIKRLLKRWKNDRFMKMYLNDCFELYSDAIPTLKQTVRDYKLKRYEEANIEMSAVMDSAVTCEDGFGERSIVSPLTKRSNDTFQLSAIALSIINIANI